MQPRKIGSLVKLKETDVSRGADEQHGVGIVVSCKELYYKNMSEDNKHRVYKIHWSNLEMIKSHFEHELEDM